ncbi:glutamate [NMDA] receptor subunit 1-like [Homarus americanus]|uniref:glutamate [NMDA] receptor subunit 1-like n=1 Tax=Homarus americanus TaxID=6706 RepID=UPI001C48AF24|nr:glutamate [NMDA] receptor subunit 1-like [Homarus americanus]
MAIRREIFPQNPGQVCPPCTAGSGGGRRKVHCRGDLTVEGLAHFYGQMKSLGYHITVLAVTAMTAASVNSENVGEPMEQVGVDVGVMVSQVVEHHLTGCHLVLITTTQHSHVFSSTSRHIRSTVEAGVVVEAGWVLSQDQQTQDHLLQGLWGDTRTTCRGLILDLTANDSAAFPLRFLESAMLWKLSETRVVVVGGRAEVKHVLLHHTLRNTVHAFYVALPDLTLHTPPRNSSSRLRKDLPQKASVSERVWVYRRCLYCNNGEADVQLILEPNITSSLFHNQFQNFRGHRMRIVSVPHFPYMDYERKINMRGGIVKPRDSLDTRLITSFSAALNFTYDIYAEPDRSFGDERDGNFTGMIGQLQREESDFCTIMAATRGRLKVVEFFRAYPSDLMVVTSLKPSLLPAHLSFIRPFADVIWFALLASVVTWGGLMWLLQRASSRVVGGRAVRFNTILLYGWGALLEQPPSDPSVSVSGQVLVGWWLVFCLIIATGFRSSLIAHLTVQGKSPTPESFQDLVDRKNWRWATEPWLYKGAAYEYFAKHTDAVVNQIFKGMEVLVAEEALQQVLEGGFSLIDFQNYISVVVASRYTDSLGNTPFYISSNGISVLGSSGWSFRKGAPFYGRFLQLKSKLEDAGIINYWTGKIIEKRVKENREAAAMDEKATQASLGEDDETQEVLGLRHLQGAFYVMFLGSSFAFLTFMGEIFIYSHPTLQ